MFLFHREVSNILLDTVVLEGPVLVHLLKLTVIQIVYLCDLGWIYLESNWVPMPILESLPKTEWLKQKMSSVMPNGFRSVEDVTFPRRVSGLCDSFPKMQPTWGDISGALPLPRSLAGTGKPLFNFYVPSFLWIGPVFKFLEPCLYFSCLNGFLICELFPVIHIVLGWSCSVEESTLWKREMGYTVKVFWEFVKLFILRIFHFIIFSKEIEALWI